MGDEETRQRSASYEVEQLGTVQHLIRLSLYRPSDKRDFGPVIVPAAQYLLMGDNRDNSVDSRYLGFFPRNEIVGQPRHVALSLDPDNHYLPRQQRFVVPLDDPAAVRWHAKYPRHQLSQLRPARIISGLRGPRAPFRRGGRVVECT